MTFLIFYVCVLLAIGFMDYKKVKGFDDYVVAGRRQHTGLVTFSILASVVGASSTMGVIKMAYKIGFPAFWWLGVGAVGLILQSIFISQKIQSAGAYTLPDLAEKYMGREVRLLVSLIIVLAWPGIIAAQLIAAAKIVSALAGFESAWIIVITAAVIIVYSALGGQASVLKTDFLQFAILALAIVYMVFFLYSTEPVQLKIELINADFTPYSMVHFLFLVGGSYLICPIIFSRLFTAQNSRTACKASLISGISVIFISAMITLIGVWAHYSLPSIGEADVLTHIILNKLPQAGGMIVIIGLLSAIISSADTCLIVTASIIEYDFLGGKKTQTTRILVIIVGVFATLLAIREQDIISLLLSAYSVFTAGIAPPLFIALVSAKKLNRRLAFAAISCGGAMAMASDIMGVEPLALAGLGVSVLFSITALYFPEKTPEFANA